jgi:hypothetical protein
MSREQRQVGFKTILALLKQRRMHLSVGVIFTLLPFAMGAMFLLVTTLTDFDIPDADYDSITSNGKLTTATITDIETQRNITINNAHPSIISYKYVKEGVESNGIYRSLDPDKINRMDIGDTIQIKYLADSSMVVGLEPFTFPFDVLLNILIPFLVMGLMMLGLLYLRIRKELNLYRHGQVKDAEVISMTPKSGLPISGIGQGVTVNYQYKNTRGQSILGESFTSDYTILNSKRQGDTVKIFVSVDNESKSCLIPKLEEIRNDWKID